MSTALVFGGQGSQFPGMGRDIYFYSQKARNVFELATSIVGYDVANICFDAPQELLNKTIYCQICTLAVELALYEVFKDQAVQFDAVAGFSLGEYAALVASNVISMENAFRLVFLRAQAMEESMEDAIGKMAAVINLDIKQIEEICESIGTDKVMIANYNSYKQFVVSFAADIYESLVEKVRYLGGHIIPLNVNRPFHHPLMRPAADKYCVDLKRYKFEMPNHPLYINVTGEKFNKHDSFVKRLYEQIFMPVQWIKTVENMLLDGIETFFEISPRSTLASFINNISGGSAKVVDVQAK